MIGDLQQARARAGQRPGCITVHDPPDGNGYLLIDRVVHQLVTEHEIAARFAQQPCPECLTELGDHLTRLADRL